MEVKYDDGKSVTFTGKARMKWAKLSQESARLTAYLRNGRMLSFDANRLPDTVRALALLHGLKQKMHDECNMNVTAEEDEEKLQAMFARLERGAWFTDERESTGGMLAEAIRRVMGGELVKIAEKLKAMGAKDRAALEANVKIKAELEKIREEKGKGVEAVDDDTLIEMFA